MAKCGDCIHFQQCSHYVTAEETFPEVGGCSAFKNKGDFVEVVRCKDCKHWHHMEDGFGDCSHPHFHLDGYPDPTMKMDDFCSCGEMREGE